jgi:hypothetical protein
VRSFQEKNDKMLSGNNMSSENMLSDNIVLLDNMFSDIKILSALIVILSDNIFKNFSEKLAKFRIAKFLVKVTFSN